LAKQWASIVSASTWSAYGWAGALKIMHPRTDDELVFAARFREEAMHTAVLSHLNIATLFDYGEDDGLAYLVMELVRGVTLQQLLNDDGAQPPSRVRSVIGQAALALSVAHEAGIVHRDVKPANIMVTKDGTVKLTDFGIARSADSAGLTRHGELLGTPHYVSPEQALGEVATPASDIYALGVVAHELLSGRRPFDKGTPVATAIAQVQESPPPLPEGVPDDLRQVIEACLAKDPADRPSTALEVAEALGAAGLESSWEPGDEAPAAKRATAAPLTDDLRVVPRRGIVAETEPMSLPPDWDDPDPTPPPGALDVLMDDSDDGSAIDDPSTDEIAKGAFAGAAEVRERLADDADAAGQTDGQADPESTRWWMPGAVVEDEPVAVTADPWPEAEAPPTPVQFDDVPPVPIPSPDAGPSGLVVHEIPDAPVRLPKPSQTAVPVGWVVVLVVVAVVVAVVFDRLVL